MLTRSAFCVTCGFAALATAYAITPDVPRFAPSAATSASTVRSLRQPRSLTSAARNARQPALHMAAASSATSGGGSSMTSSIINLSKNIVGSGVLALAAGVAAFTASPMGVLPALAVLLFLGGASGYTFSLIARVGTEVGADSYRDAWTKVFGAGTAFIPAITILFKTLVGGFCYSIILGDLTASIAKLLGLPALFHSSNAWIILLSATVLLPLSLMRDLSSLAFGSVIGTAGTLYTALFIWLRKLDGSYAAGGGYHQLIAESARPSFAAATAAQPLINSGIFVLVSMLATAFLAHYNAPKFYNSLEAPADGSSKQAAFNKVCFAAFGLAALLCASIMAGGFLTFGGASQGLILNSYATSDPLALLARVGICASIVFSYPLNFVGLRDGVLSMLKLDGSKGSVHTITTVALLCAMNGLSLVIKNLGLVVAIGGAALGTSLVYTFPALMFIQATRLKGKELRAKGQSLPAGRVREMYANMGLVGLGLSLGLLGVQISLRSAGGGH